MSSQVRVRACVNECMCEELLSPSCKCECQREVGLVVSHRPGVLQLEKFETQHNLVSNKRISVPADLISTDAQEHKLRQKNVMMYLLLSAIFTRPLVSATPSLRFWFRFLKAHPFTHLPIYPPNHSSRQILKPEFIPPFLWKPTQTNPILPAKNSQPARQQYNVFLSLPQ